MALPLDVISGPFAEHVVVRYMSAGKSISTEKTGIAYVGQPPAACPDAAGRARATLVGLSGKL